MFAQEELTRLRTRKAELLNQVERDRSAVKAAFREAQAGLLGVQRIGQVFRGALQWRSLILPIALLIMPRRARAAVRLVSEAARAFRLASTVTALWRGLTEKPPSQGPRTGLA